MIYFLSRAFISKGHFVTLINRDAADCKHLARRLKATVVNGDGSDPEILEDAGVRMADAFLAVTSNDEDNLVACQIAERRFGVRRTLAMVTDPDNESVFKDLGVDRVFSLTGIVTSLIEQHAGFEDVTSLVPVGEGRFHATEMVLDGDSPALGRPLRDLGLPKRSLIAAVLRGEEPVVPRGNTVLEEGDRVILITLPEDYPAALKTLSGDET